MNDDVIGIYIMGMFTGMYDRQYVMGVRGCEMTEKMMIAQWTSRYYGFIQTQMGVSETGIVSKISVINAYK